MSKYNMISKLIRYGVHKSTPFIITVTSEGYLCGYIGISSNDRKLLNQTYPNIELDNDIPEITYDTEVSPVVSGFKHNKPVEHWLGFDNNHYNQKPSVDVIKKYFPLFGDNIDYLAFIARKASNMGPNAVFVTEDETEKLCFRLIENIVRIKENDENE